MRMLQLELEEDRELFPYQDEIWPGESGQGYVLRMAAGNGLGGIGRVKRMLGCSRFQTLYAQDAPQLAFWFGASVPRLVYAMESSHGSRRVEGSLYMGHSLGRSYFVNRSHPRVCPECVQDLGYCRAAWDFTLNVACARHQRALIDRCPACASPLTWTRPNLCLCECGHPWSTLDARTSATDGELLVAHLIDRRMDDQNRVAKGASPRHEWAESSMNALWLLLEDLSMDGVFRMLFAFATAAGYEMDVPTERRLRAAMPKAQQTIAMGIAVGIKLTQQKHVCMRASSSVLINLLRESSAEGLIRTFDASVACSLLETLSLSKNAASVRSSRNAPLSQLVLF